MALLPYLQDQDASPELKAAFAKRPQVFNVSRMMANAQQVFLARDRLSQALFHQIKLKPKFRELAILRTAKLCHAPYEWAHHVPSAKSVGVTDQQVAAIENWQNAACFDPVERLVLKLTDEVNTNVKGSRETVEGLKQHLNPGEIVELLMIIGHWRQTASILETLEVELDQFAGQVNVLDR